MKITIFDNLPDGGAKRTVHEQIKHLAKNHQITYITHHHQSKFIANPKQVTNKKFELEWLKFKGLSRPLQELNLYSQVKNKYQEIANYIDKSKPDIVLVHPCMFTQAPILLRYLKTPSVYFAQELPRVVYEPDLNPIDQFNPINKLYEQTRRQLLKNADLKNTQSATKLITHTKYIAGLINKHYKTTPAINPLGVDTKKFTPNLKAKPKHFLFIGEKEYINGHILLEELTITNPRLPIKYINQNDSGYVSESDLVKLYQQSIAVLCLAVREPFGLVPLEAMACGVPVIATNEGGHKETIINNITGFLIPRKKTALKKAITTLQNNPQLRAKLGKAGRNHVVKNYTWKQHSAKLEEVLKDITK